MLLPAPAGTTLIADGTVPLETFSVTGTTVPTGNTSAWLQFPGAGPAGTVKLVPATTKVNIPPVGTPVPAILQILRRPVVDVFRNVTMVVPPVLTVTVAVPAARLLVTSQTGRQGGDRREPGNVRNGFP